MATALDLPGRVSRSVSATDQPMTNSGGTSPTSNRRTKYGVARGMLEKFNANQDTEQSVCSSRQRRTNSTARMKSNNSRVPLRTRPDLLPPRWYVRTPWSTMKVCVIMETWASSWTWKYLYLYPYPYPYSYSYPYSYPYPYPYPYLYPCPYPCPYPCLTIQANGKSECNMRILTKRLPGNCWRTWRRSGKD